jgi:hypothetical protein
MHTAKTHTILRGLVAAALVVALAAPGAAAVKKIAYPEVKVTLDKPYKPDAPFEKMHAAFLDAVKRKDLQALTALVAPTFLWTVGDTPADELDLGRDAIHNFKVAFGFRGLGKDVDGGVDNGPYWDVLASFADDPTYYATTDSGNLVCGPIAAEVADDRIFEQARKKIETARRVVFHLGRDRCRQGPRRHRRAGRQGRHRGAALAQLLSAREGRRAAASADPFRGAAAIGANRLGAGHRGAPA